MEGAEEQQPEQSPSSAQEEAILAKEILTDDHHQYDSVSDAVNSTSGDGVHDNLTGLPNRIVMAECLERGFAQVQRAENTELAVLCLDIDNFKDINNLFGLSAGDALLVDIANRINSCLRTGDMVSRAESSITVTHFVGDEFTILLDDLKRPSDAYTVSLRIQEALKEPFDIHGNRVYITASIGIAVSTAEYHQASDILRDANVAMARAKSLGKGHIELYDVKMQTQLADRIALEAEIRSGFARGEFCVYYQPIVDLASGKVHALEALTRWNHPEKGVLSPGYFMDFVEEIDLVIEFDRQVLWHACEKAKEWNHTICADSPIVVNVNMSSKQFVTNNLVDYVDHVVTKLGVKAESLVLEITESLLMEHTEVVAGQFKRLREKGIKLALDDFGTGYSSLNYLHRFPTESLKIDGSFISRLSQPQGKAIVKTVINLGHELGMKVVAEGVETKKQLDILRDLGCEYAQGYLFSRPMADKEISRLLGSNLKW